MTRFAPIRFPNARLAALITRRTLGGGFALVFGALAWVAARGDWAPRPETLAELTGGSQGAALVHGLTLRAVWSQLLLLTAPWMVLRCAGIVPRWRAGEGAWLGSSPATRGSLAAAACGGIALALVAVTGVAALVAAFAAGEEGGRPARLRIESTLTAGTLVLDGGGPRALELSAEALTPRTRFVRARVVPIGAGHAATVRLTLVRGGERREVQARVSAPTELRLAVPAVAATETSGLVLELERLGPGPVVALPGGEFELLAELPHARGPDLALAARALLTLVAWCALAFGLGAWMHPVVAGMLTLASALLVLTGSGGAWADALGALPGRGLAEALRIVGEGLVPARLRPVEVLAAGATALLGWALARAGLRDWRGAGA